MGDPQGRVAGVEEFAVAPAVSLEGERGGVEVAAVGLDHEAVFRPEEVDLDAAVDALDRGVEERGRQVTAEEERQDLGLERALEPASPGERRGASPFADEGAQRLRPPPAG